MPQIGMPQAGDPKTPLLETTTPDGKYRYVLYEWGVVGVQKPRMLDGEDSYETEYVIRAQICPCPGHQYRGTCKHVDVAAALQRYYAQNASLPALGAVSLPS